MLSYNLYIALFTILPPCLKALKAFFILFFPKKYPYYQYKKFSFMPKFSKEISSQK